MSVLGKGTSQTSIASLCEDMYLTPRSSGRKPDMGTNFTPHTAACHFLFADGSVHAIPFGTDVATMRALGTINGGETIDQSGF